MGSQYQMEIEIVADNKASKELSKIDGQVKDSTKSLEKLGAVVAGAFAIKKIADFGMEMTSTATRLDQLEKKSNTVLGEFKDDVEDVARSVSASMGLTNAQFLSATTNIADLLIPMKFTREQASGMSTDLVKLSGALSEWSGGQRTATEVTDILSKAMLGEREQLKTLGIAINEKEVVERAAIIIQERGIQATEAQAKAMATMELIYEKSSDAQTAYKNGGDSLIRKQAEMQASMQSIKESIAMALTPAVADTTSKLADMVSKTMESEETMRNLEITFNAIGETIIFVTDGVIGFTNAIGKALDATADFIVRSQAALKIGAGKEIGKNYLKPEYRADGGPVATGKPYIVGERGPELFVPKGNGHIVPNHASPNININFGGVNVSKQSDINMIADKVQEVIVGSIKNLQLGVA